jgi:hypothetical protein
MTNGVLDHAFDMRRETLLAFHVVVGAEFYFHPEISFRQF